jgi:cyanophycin synthetase
VRSWKQVIKFRPDGTPTPVPVISKAVMPMSESAAAVEETAFASMEGLVRDERGIHLSREQDD